MIDVGVRDVAEFPAMGLSVWSKWVNAQGAVKASLGAVNVAVRFGGATINRGGPRVTDNERIGVARKGRISEVPEACVQATCERGAQTAAACGRACGARDWRANHIPSERIEIDRNFAGARRMLDT